MVKESLPYFFVGGGFFTLFIAPLLILAGMPTLWAIVCCFFAFGFFSAVLNLLLLVKDEK